MSLSKKNDLKRDFAAGALSVWGPLPTYDPMHTPPLTHCIRVYKYTYSHREGGKGEGGLTREKVRGAIVHKAGRKYQHDWLYLKPINYIQHQ